MKIKGMKELLITGEIGWDVTADFVRNELKAVDQNDELKIVVDSPGGSVYDMVAIYNIIRDFARNHKAKIETYIQGMAASCASQIALAAHDGNPDSQVIVEDNSIFMIHNAWTISWGDHRELEADAIGLSRIDNLLREVYIRKSNKTSKEIIDMMNAETFLYGQEIVDAGFADSIIKNTTLEADDMNAYALKKDNSIVSAKNSFAKMKEAMQARAESNKEHYKNSRAAACAQLISMDKIASVKLSNVNSENTKPDETGVRTEDSLMTKEELKAQNPELYDAIYNEGITAERSRVQAHIKMASDSGDVNAAVEFIDSGVNCADNAAVAKYHEVFTKNALAKARVQDLVPDTTTPPAANEGEDAEMQAFLRETGLKGAE